jgi:MULE transposase domain
MNKESELDYNWAVTHLRSLFQEEIWPSVIATDCDEALISAIELRFPEARCKTVLCYWHVSMNVLTNCKKFFETEEAWEPFLRGFKACVFAKTEEEFEDIVKEWKEDFYWNDGKPWEASLDATPEEVQEIVEKDMARSALSYCLGRWLGAYKTKLVHCYVDQFFHAGTTTTSRLEGAHHVLKQWIGKPTKDMTGVWGSVQLAINHQLEEIRTYRGQCHSGTPVRTRNEFFSALNQKITPQGQMKLYDQWTLYKSEATRLEKGEITRGSICTGTFFTSMGVPCQHMIKTRLAEGGRIQPTDFHPHWHWYRPPPGSELIVLPRPILDPETRQYRRTEEAERRSQARQYARVRRAQTGRILSQHEQQQSVLRHCSACTEYGHDKTTCRGCRSTDHTRNACPHVSYQRRIATNPMAHQHNVESQRQVAASQSHAPSLNSQVNMQFGQFPAYPSHPQAFQNAFNLAPTPLPSMPAITGYVPPGSQMSIHFLQNPAHTSSIGPPMPQNDFIPGTGYPAPTQPQAHRWNGPNNSYF